MLFESCENVAKRCASWGEATRRHAKSKERLSKCENGVDPPASLSSGGAYDIVCCAVVGLMFPGLEARSQFVSQDVLHRIKETNTFHCFSPKAHK